MRDTRATQSWEILDDHFSGIDGNDITTKRFQWPGFTHPVLSSALSEAMAGVAAELNGVNQLNHFEALSIAGMWTRHANQPVSITPPQYREVDIGEAEPIVALDAGLWTFRLAGEPVALVLSRFTTPRNDSQSVVEIAFQPSATTIAFIRQLFDALAAAIRAAPPYRGKTLSFESRPAFNGKAGDILVHRLAPVAREAVILDDVTMAKLDRHVFSFARQAAALKKLGQSTRKGLLLYGPPGTGKTHSLRYISTNLPGYTTFLITGGEVGRLTTYMEAARLLQPSIVILEDVDLIARAREQHGSDKSEVLLNQLLNEMDGLREDCDIFFLLTTNRPEAIEEALYSRPGRIDEAIAILPPDADCRRRLLALYGQALSFEDDAIERTVARTDGASAALMKELVRRFALASLEQDEAGRITPAIVDAVLDVTTSPAEAAGRQLLGMNMARRREACC